MRGDVLTTTGSEPSWPAFMFTGPFQVPPLSHLCQRPPSVPFQNTSTIPFDWPAAVGSPPTRPAFTSCTGLAQAPPLNRLCHKVPPVPCQNTSSTPNEGLTATGLETSSLAPMSSGPCHAPPLNHLCHRLRLVPFQNTSTI